MNNTNSCTSCHEAAEVYSPPCSHSVCYKCLEKSTPNSEKKIACPSCKLHFNLDVRSQGRLDMLIEANKPGPKQCLDKTNEGKFVCTSCRQYYCENCKQAHLNQESTRKHQIIPIEEMKTKESRFLPTHCPKHLSKELEFFCQNCAQILCGDCLPPHRLHHWNSLNEIILENEKKDLFSRLETVTIISSFFSE